MCAPLFFSKGVYHNMTTTSKTWRPESAPGLRVPSALSLRPSNTIVIMGRNPFRSRTSG